MPVEANDPQVRCDVLVIGAGPAGIAAATVSAESGADVILLDDNPRIGGQIWRGSLSDELKRRWLRRLRDSRATIRLSTAAIASFGKGKLLTEFSNRPQLLYYEKVIVATGARELFLPFPGWTLPGVVGIGGLQALVSTGLHIKNKRVMIAGSGPLLLAVATHLLHFGAKVVAIVEQAPWSQLLRFGSSLAGYPAKLLQAAQLKLASWSVPLLAGSWILEAKGDGRVSEAVVRTPSGNREISCDYLACGFGLTPNTELAAALGCGLREGLVVVDQWQASSIPGVYCAGEPTGIGGLDRSLVEGEIAGFAAAGRPENARQLFAQRRKQHRFAHRLAAGFALRDELKRLPAEDTLICRCEDVTFGAAKSCSDARSARLHARCGMGPCQGRICGPALRFVLGWEGASGAARPPVLPASMASLSALESEQNP